MVPSGYGPGGISLYEFQKEAGHFSPALLYEVSSMMLTCAPLSMVASNGTPSAIRATVGTMPCGAVIAAMCSTSRHPKSLECLEPHVELVVLM